MAQRKRTAMTATRDYLIKHARAVRAGQIPSKKGWLTAEEIAFKENFRPNTVFRELKRMAAFGFADVHLREDYVFSENGRVKTCLRPFYRLSPTFLSQMTWALGIVPDKKAA